MAVSICVSKTWPWCVHQPSIRWLPVYGIWASLRKKLYIKWWLICIWKHVDFRCSNCIKTIDWCMCKKQFVIHRLISIKSNSLSVGEFAEKAIRCQCIDMHKNPLVTRLWICIPTIRYLLVNMWSWLLLLGLLYSLFNCSQKSKLVLDLRSLLIIN